MPTTTGDALRDLCNTNLECICLMSRSLLILPFLLLLFHERASAAGLPFAPNPESFFRYIESVSFEGNQSAGLAPGPVKVISGNECGFRGQMLDGSPNTDWYWCRSVYVRQSTPLGTKVCLVEAGFGSSGESSAWMRIKQCRYRD